MNACRGRCKAQVSGIVCRLGGIPCPQHRPSEQVSDPCAAPASTGVVRHELCKHADREKFSKACLCDQLHSAGLCGGSLGNAQGSLPGIQRLLVLQSQAPVAWAPQREGMALRKRRPNARTAMLTGHERHSGQGNEQLLEGNLKCLEDLLQI